MLKYLHLTNVGLLPEVRVDWAPRLNLIAGDNGLGKSFLLDLAWWALTRTWAGAVALPMLARSMESEQVIEAAEAFMRDEKTLPAGLDTKTAIQARLQALLPAGDAFWPRWLVETRSFKSAARAKK